MTPLKIDENLYQYCTPRQRETLEAIDRLGSAKAASIELGMNIGGASETYLAVKKKAAKKGYAPEHDFTRPVPDGYVAKGVSTYYNAEGKPAGQWVKASLSHQALVDAMREAVDGFKDEILPASVIIAPEGSEEHLCNLYTFTDYHLGMLAWHKEGGSDWSIAIAEKTILAALVQMVNQSPSAHTAVLNIQGDFLHTDGKTPVTPASKHVLDADSRFPKIRRSAIRIIRSLVAICLQRHQEVRLIIAEGNHDEESAGWLSDLFAVHYEEEPRVTVNDSVLPFYVFEWGTTMLGIHHGHKVKNESLPLLFAAQFPQEWGRTTRREIHCGHRHHRDEKEYNGVTVVQHPTLAARDAYAARGGWIADRAAWAITYHKKYGAVGRVMITTEMLEIT
ncbi:MAG: hypothetical protein JGK24_30485 [Microcoleus sp. PH2017_29_MFU_D_A]|uniref:hypothetical protein n=1 Tax=Microcoleus sp. PH2017_29_MFU_D_A TaxID=2798839 RepID=UPI001DE20555|nr:hypothetical protein [Microcoleus sp. PH2017_29_MFU_D_A]MCC3607439.1 hypothetical protein [Microcoleus sp. PH2017_29_MFU_D_A]